MIAAKPGVQAGHHRVALGLLTVAVSACSRAAKKQQSGGFEAWTRTHTVPIQTVEPSKDVADLGPVRAIIGAARVVALGEPIHGAHQPLAFRNRLFQYLVENMGFTAIVLESGLPESRRIFDWVRGGPGDVAPIVRENLTWGFGSFRENEQLVSWIRAYNADRAHNRTVHFYGMDLSVTGPGGLIPTRIPVDQALAYLTRVDSVSARQMRAGFEPLLSRLSTKRSPPLTRVEHDALTAAIDDLIALLERHHGEFVAITAGPDYEWAVRNAILARQADRAFRLVPPIMPNGKVPKEAWQEAWTARDAAMAENTLWALDREGPAGRILVYAHNFHVMNAAVKGGIWDSIGQPPMVMGRYLHSALGTDLVIIGMSGGASGGGLHAAAPDSASVDAAFARVGIPRYLVDLRTAGSDPTALAWLREERSFGTRMVLTLAPAVAFDAVLFVDTLTPAGGT